MKDDNVETPNVLTPEERERRHRRRVQDCDDARLRLHLREHLIRKFHEGELRVAALDNIVMTDDEFDRSLEIMETAMDEMMAKRRTLLEAGDNGGA